MLNITIPAREEFDSDTGCFSYYEATNLSLEHSLLAISKWESKWQKPFFDKSLSFLFLKYLQPYFSYYIPAFIHIFSTISSAVLFDVSITKWAEI